MEVSTDPYEQKLFQMFTSHDVTSVGSLDETALSKLCQTLELRDREPILIAACLQNADTNRRVTFKGFKEGLLTLLGGADPDEASDYHIHHLSTTTDDDVDEHYDGGASAKDGGKKIASPTREVSPKFVVSGKKYGRRSRPPSGAFDDSSASDSDADATVIVARVGEGAEQQPQTHKSTKGSTSSTTKVQRSSSHSDLHNGGPRKRRPAAGSKLKRCASLPAQPKPPKRDESAATAMLLAQRESSVESLGNLDFENLSHSLKVVWTDHGRATNDYLNQEQLELVCAQVGLHGKIARKVADEVFEKLGLDGRNASDRISFDDFIGLIQTDGGPFDGPESSSRSSSPPPTPSTVRGARTSTLTTDDIDSCIESVESLLNTSKDSAISSTGNDMHVHSGEWPIESSAVSSDIIVDMWDSAGIPNSRSLLKNLGFQTKEIRISQLSLAIDDDLQGMPAQDDDSNAQLLLRASLALHKSEVNALQLAFRQMATQNRKLHNNNVDVNRRAALLAQEVDERHSHLENTARNEIRQLEQRHAEIVRDLTTQLTNDREHWTALSTKLEQRIKTIESEDARLRLQCQMTDQENSALETEQISLQKQVADLLEENIRLNNELADEGERQRADESRKGDLENEELLELMEKISVLQLENSNLRDRNDELVNELEEKSAELVKIRSKKSSRLEGVASEMDAASGSATKRRGDSPSKAKICAESPKLGKLRKCSNEFAGELPDSESSGDWMALNAELNQSALTSAADAKDEEIQKLSDKIVELEATIKKMSDGDTSELSTRNVELESSLEQMRKEFEDLEDYWQGKLNDERVLYEIEQQKSQDKIEDVLKKLSEYEEQFLAGLEKDGRLSPIDEKQSLEQQYNDLETEMEELRTQAREILDNKSIEIESLQEKVKKLQHRVIESAAASEVASLGRASSQTPDHESPASSPISYLWTQSTIQAPARDYQNPNWSKPNATANVMDPESNMFANQIAPIQRPITPMRGVEEKRGDSDASSVKSFGTHSVASTHSIHNSLPMCSSPSQLREEIKRLKMIEIQLKAGIQELAEGRDCLLMEVQQLQEAKPALERAFARTSHPSLMQRISQLEQRNRNLQFCLKQQQIYTETMIQQSWQQQRSEMSDMQGRIEAQGIIISEQSQRLVKNDLLVKEFFVENAQLSERLEQLRSRNSMVMHGQPQNL